ncbi:MAG TPA: aminotransferase class I/II-fold pyridoxal phosphate-dependent enzyme, partial [Longilinea sp.]|nr:aminotransferase class I/II-fold pyridoxal phosphate-dependent enzyme [Longilinea sp.]
AHHLVLFSDEMYRLLEYNPAKRLPPACDLYEQAISLSGLSKSFALPGLRAGWLATRDERLFHAWMLYKDYTTICSSAPSEILALAALRARDRIIRRNLDIIAANLTLANQFFAEFENLFDWLPPMGGSIAFPRLKTGQAVDAFCKDVLRQKDVMLVPGSMFDFPGNHFRLGLGRKNFPEAIGLVGEYLHDINQARF